MLNTMKNPIVNSKRQLELDLARGIAVFCMIAVHVQSNLMVEKVVHTKFGGIIEFLGTLPAAPVFMFLLGAGIIYSKNNTYQDYLKRGMNVIALGYLLNVIKVVITFLPYVFKGVWKDHLGYLIEGIIAVDILQFAGLAFIFFGLLIKFNITLSTTIIITIFISIANYFLLLFKTDNYLLSAISGLFWGSNDWSSFPFATWIFYPVAGYCFGSCLIRQVDKRRFYKTILCYASLSLFLFSLMAFIFHLDTGLLTELSYYDHTFFNNLLYTSFVLAWVSIIYYATDYLPTICVTTLKRWSYQVNAIYFIHWVIISIVVATMGFQKLPVTFYVLCFIMILILSDSIAYIRKEFTHTKL